ncbi:MAG: tRNA uridine-5-carboxymethylaminomethyl(34) synthesis GTPase MnmE [Cytophagaceae bacterium]|nr:tRNA uridine-5-carboxymethylaminomethyl(34) synthesis GTPase MnmE [Cytophagaceae bacterium]MDW8456389.1 tRNA uridine-5-carboxymethylaminomethyl(34) synthesis GTPase MnmE [Cytophagaceae bacterium]
MNYTLYTSNDDTIVAPATAPGMAAIAVIRMSGKDAFAIANQIFKGKNLENVQSHTIHFGTIEYDGKIIDEVLVSVFKAPKSFTKENVVEISCHGSDYIVKKILSLLILHGARMAAPGEFTRRAFLNGRFDLAQAEAVADLIACDSESSHDLAIKQMRGGISTEIYNLREELIQFTALMELELDFTEEDVEFANRNELMALVEKILALTRRLASTFEYGNAIKNGVNTVIAGRPNAGKSTLLNALLNEDRAIVSDIPGTTRDTIEETIYIEGIAFRLIDTAGIREAADQIEAIGVQKTMEKIRTASIVLYVFDAAKLSVDEVRSDIQQLRHPSAGLIVVANKSDLLNTNINYPLIDNDITDGIITISALNRSNIDELKKILFTFVTKDVQTANTVVSNLRHYEALRAAEHALLAVKEGIAAHRTTELIAEDLREALRHLGSITSQVSVDQDVLGAIFSRFCIGK